MASIIILDLALTGALLLLIVGSVWFQVSHHMWLKAYGTDVSALITQVRRDNRTHQTCLVTAAWTDPRTGRRWTFQGYRFDLGYRAGQLVGIRLDPEHPSHYIMER
jgi:hypothetical protein